MKNYPADLVFVGPGLVPICFCCQFNDKVKRLSFYQFLLNFCWFHFKLNSLGPETTSKQINQKCCLLKLSAAYIC